MMANLAPASSWDDVVQHETGTAVVGGPGGTMNQQAQSLLNRFGYLGSQYGATKISYKLEFPGAVTRTIASRAEACIEAADFGLAADNADGLRAAMSDADFQTQRRYGSLRHINGVNSTNGIADMANFAGQGLSSGVPIGWVFHHYTDGKLLQIDNVGSGPVLTLKNARNPTRRPDKPSNYVGEGNYLELLRDDGTGTSVQEAFINKDLDIVWRTRPLKRISGKSDTSSWAFQDSTYSTHTYFREVRQAGQQVYYEKDTGSEYAVILGANRTTFALRADGASSVLKLSAGSGQVVIDTGSVLWGLGNLALNATGSLIDMRKPVQLMKYSTGSLPTLGSTDRCMAWDTTLDKPVFWNGTQWKTVNFA
jgi:hypothetical protein